jgi:regulator of protease activity HflC (stomatin/prohibitin superfamily)
MTKMKFPSFKFPFFKRNNDSGQSFDSRSSNEGTPTPPSSVNIFGWLKLAAAVVVLAIVAFNSFKVVPRGYVATQSVFGVLDPQPLLAGFNIINPLSSITLHNVLVTPKQAVAKSGSHDLQKVTTKVTVSYNLVDSQAPVFFREYGSIENFIEAILDPAIQESVKAATAHFTATDLWTKRETVRDEIEQFVRANVASAMASKKAPGTVTINRVTLDNLDFTPMFAAALEANVKAINDAGRAVNEGKKLIADAEGDAQSIKAKADAEAYATLQIATKEAEAIRRESAALRDSPDLVELTAITRWKGKVPRFNGTMPMNAAPDVVPAAAPAAAQTK